jgi:hypothetical protein
MARREGLLPRRESLWLGEDRLVETRKVALCNRPYPASNVRNLKYDG